MDGLTPIFLPLDKGNYARVHVKQNKSYGGTLGRELINQYGSKHLHINLINPDTHRAISFRVPYGALPECIKVGSRLLNTRNVLELIESLTGKRLIQKRQDKAYKTAINTIIRIPSTL